MSLDLGCGACELSDDPFAGSIECVNGGDCGDASRIRGGASVSVSGSVSGSASVGGGGWGCRVVTRCVSNLDNAPTNREPKESDSDKEDDEED